MTPTRNNTNSPRKNVLVRDNLLARQLRRREPEAINKLYDRFFAILYLFFSSETGDQRTTEMLVERVFLVALQAFAGEITFTEGCGVWLLGIARLVLAAWKQKCTLSEMTLSVQELEMLGSHVLANVLTTSFLWQLVERLPPNLQQVLRLRYEQELTYGEIAFHIGKTTSRCKQMHEQAMKQLRALIQDGLGDIILTQDSINRKDD